MRKPKTVALLKPLARKLRAIRFWKDMSQEDILINVYPEANDEHRALVSQWENARREPLRHVLIRYARLADTTLEQIMIDDVPLPAHITRDFERFGGDIRRKREWEANQKTASDGAEKVLSDSSQKKTNSTDTAENDAADKYSDKDKDTQETSIDEDITYGEEFTHLSLVIADEPTEAATFELPVKTLDKLHDLHLVLLGRLPRRRRPSLTVNGVVNLCVNTVLVNDKYYEKESFISRQTQVLADAGEQQNQAAAIE